MSVFVAMRKASLSIWSDAVIELATFSTIVHSEVWVLEEAQQKQLAYAAFDDADPCFTQRVAPTDSCHWVLLRIPVSVENVPRAHSFLQDIRNANLQYRLPWECGCPQFLLHELENDLDCNRPDTWGSVFCSQATLLFLRRCACANLITVPTAPLFEADSNGVSPAQLYRTLTRMGCEVVNA